MGGFGSGRCGGRPTIESGLTLDINRLLRHRNIVPGDQCFGSLKWRNVATGEDVGSVSYEACLADADDAWLRLRYSVDDSAQDYRVALDSTPCHYGGRRWWFVCPRSGRRVAKLHLPPGGTLFAARRAYGLAYRSQRETALDRSHDRQRRLYRKLGAEYEYFEQAPPRRPKGLHRRTYERLTGELYAASEIHEWLFALGVTPLLARLNKAAAARRGCNS
jgi:hypothetical protein